MFEIDAKSEIRNQKSVIRFGVIGCGWVARDYGIPAIIEARNAELVAVCDTNFENLKPFAENQDILRTTDFDEFLCAKNLDAVYIATPNDSHRVLTGEMRGGGQARFVRKADGDWI